MPLYTVVAAALAAARDGDGAAAECGAANFSVDRSQQQCKGLTEVDTATSAAACVAACCAQRGCTVWQWCASADDCPDAGYGAGCWTGTSVRDCGPTSDKWAGGSRGGCAFPDSLTGQRCMGLDGVPAAASPAACEAACCGDDACHAWNWNADESPPCWVGGRARCAAGAAGWAGGARGPRPPTPAPTPAPTSTSGFDVAVANATLHLAWAATCNESALRAWDCQWCSGPHGAGPVALEAFMHNKLAGTQGYVGVDAAGGRVIVAYRGSDDWQNDFQDAEFWKNRNLTGFGPQDVAVDQGFFAAYKSVRNETTTAVTAALRRCAGCSVLFTGHSLGAAMATLGACDYAGGHSGVAVHLYNFGSPRVGNKAFAAWAGQVLASATRVRREKDIVPAVPPRLIEYAHVATEVWNRHAEGQQDWYVTCDASGEDKACGDSEETPVFPLDLLHLSPKEHCLYMGYQGCSCIGQD